jgi:Cu/Ag efflux protein CusF
MKARVRSTWNLAVAAVLLTMLAACGNSAPKTAASRGVVTAIDAAAHAITLDHEHIPGVMTAMTMTFAVAPEVSLEGIEPGAKVDFSVRQDARGGITVTELRRSGS